MIRKQKKSLSSSIFCFFLAAAMIVQVRPSAGRPGNILNTVATPSVGAPAQEKRDIGAGDLSYASRTGALEYAYNLVVPPGRLGIQPKVSLTYSSQGSHRGGIASNWSMSQPMIHRDLRDTSLNMGPHTLDHYKLPYASSLSGGHRLVVVDEPVEQGWRAYRAEYDEQYIRYERSVSNVNRKGMWRARTTDGMTWYFGVGHEGENDTHDTSVFGSLVFRSDSMASLDLSDRQPLTRTVDKYGNTVRYFWEADVNAAGQVEELRLRSIRYTENFSAGLASHAQVDFVYESEPSYCSTTPLKRELPVGASVDYRGGYPWYSGRRTLKEIRTFVRDEPNGVERRVRTVELGITDNCPTEGGGHRRLDSITLKDSDNADFELIPPTTFEYGQAGRLFDAPAKSYNTFFNQGQGAPVPSGISWGHIHGFGDLHAEATLQQTLIDFNGDGRLDVLRAAPQDACSFDLFLNNGTGFDAPDRLLFPAEGLLWRDGADEPGLGEGCSLSSRRTLWRNAGNSGQCQRRSYGTYLTHRFIDMNNDGSPDLVTAKRIDAQHVATNLRTVPGVSEVLTSELPEDLLPGDQCAIGSFRSLPTLVPPCVDGECFECMSSDRRSINNRPFVRAACGHWPTVTEEDIHNGGCHDTGTLSLEVDGFFPWTVYYNRGRRTRIRNGQEATSWYSSVGETVWSPIPLDPSSTESSLGNSNGGGLSSSFHAVRDITGDGVVDAIVTSDGKGFPHWFVFPGEIDRHDGEFLGFEQEPVWWTTPEGAKPSVSDLDYDLVAEVAQSSTKSQLVDMNGDGLPDLVRTRDSDHLEVAMNMGSGFCAWDGTLGPGELASRLQGRLSRTGYSEVVGGCIELDPQDGSCMTDRLISGDGKSLVSLLDIDGDGLLDLYDAWDATSYDRLSPSPAVYPNAGGGAFREVPTPTSRYLPRETRIDTSTWAVLSGFMDIDGDGLDDIVTPNGGQLRVESDDTTDGKPQRLLNRINNGQGLVTEVTYQHYADPSVAINPTDQKRMPSNVWVVDTITSKHEIAESFRPAPDSVVDVKYGDPIYNQDHRGKYGFRGFSSIETSSPHSVVAGTAFSVTEQIYDYDLDWSGRNVETVVYADGFLKQEAASIEVRDIEELSLFDEATMSYVVTGTRQHICEDEQGAFSGYETCLLAPPLIETTSEHTAAASVLSGGALSPSVAYYRSATYLLGPGPGTANNEGDKWATDVADLYSSEDRYEFLPQSSHSDVWTDGAWERTSQMVYVLDDSVTYVAETGQDLSPHSDPFSGPDIQTGTERSLDTGVVVQARKPEQFAPAVPTILMYGPFQVTAISTTDELGYTSTTLTDLGTGATLEAYGPNPLECAPSQRAGTRSKYDVLGRPVAVFTVGCEGDTFGEYQLSSTEYVNFDGTTPAHVISTSFLDASDLSQTIVSTTYVDGVGRAIRTEVVDGTTNSDGTPGAFRTESEFDAAGNLVGQRTPNPSTEFGADATVDTVYRYDALNRLVQVQQAAAIADANVAAIDIRFGFDGLFATKTTTEVVSTASEAQAETRVYTDFLGRLTMVEERADRYGSAATRYAYDGNDNTKRITDADGVVTEMEHDWLDRRTKVTRGERLWTYGYDRNGNLQFETGPNDQSQSADNLGTGEYTTSTIFDDLDRPKSRILATRKLTAQQLDIFDAHEIGFTYDDCSNGIGRLCTATSGANLTTSYVYDWAGRAVAETRSISLPESVVDLLDGDSAPDFFESRTTYMTYDLGGRVIDAWLADGGDKESSTHVSYQYEPTGAPRALRWQGTAAQPTDVTTTLTRNKAQRIIAQSTGCLRRSWNYDDMGRVTDTEVSGGGCGTQNGTILSETEIKYLETSEVRSQKMYRVGLMDLTFNYEYDDQHQLVGAKNDISSGDVGSYNVGFQYTGAGRVYSVGDHDGGGIEGRDPMDYGDGSTIAAVLDGLEGYGNGTLAGGDWHAPVTLLSPDKDVHYSYDFSGNVTDREELDVTRNGNQSESTRWRFEYDGTDQQRQVLLEDGANGRELYYYDHTGQRYMAVTYAQAGDRVPLRIRIWIGGAEIWYASNNSGKAMELQTEYAHLSLGHLAIGRVKRDGLITTTEASFHNGLGHFMGGVDWDTGVVNAAFVYGPYGETLGGAESALVTHLRQFSSTAAEQVALHAKGGPKAGPFGDADSEASTHLRRFNGKEADQLSRLSYYGYRYYDPLSLSWTQADPLYRFVPDLAGANPREMNLYSFSMNNPVRYLDPDGLAAYQPTTTVDTPDGPMECQGGAGSSDCMYHKPLYGDQSPYGRSLAGSKAAESDNLTITGTKDQVRGFTNMLDDAATHSPVVAAQLGRIAAGDTKPVNIDLTSNDPSTYIDSYVTQAVDLDDLKELPRLSADLEHPSLRRGEIIGHFLLERATLGGGESSGRAFSKAHREAFDHQNKIRKSIGLPAISSQRPLMPQIRSGQVIRFSGHNRGQQLLIDGKKLQTAWMNRF